MLRMAHLYSEAEKQGAKIIMYDIGFASAATIADNARGPYGVFIDFNTCTNVNELKAHLAHELGHCATGALHKLTSPFELIGRNEQRANKWAITQYLPFDDIKAAMRLGFTLPWQLAEYFDVSQGFIEKALQYYINNQGLDFNA